MGRKYIPSLPDLLLPPQQSSDRIPHVAYINTSSGTTSFDFTEQLLKRFWSMSPPLQCFGMGRLCAITV